MHEHFLQASEYSLPLTIYFQKMIFREQDKAIFEEGRKLPLVEEFYTLQGEGFHSGKAAYFIRIGGCDIGCSWCDTKFSWNHALHPLVAVDEIVARIAAHPAKAVVVTGGEPLIYPLDLLTSQLHELGIHTFLETSGAYELSGNWDWICLSPKENLPPLAAIYPLAHELKVIIHDQKDIDWAEMNSIKVGKDCALFLQPEWSRYHENIEWIVEYVKNNPRWRISLQAHKFMKIP
jgi:7-carboxy-7-deazaguanine synthase